jgi:Restriction endonuclease
MSAWFRKQTLIYIIPVMLVVVLVFYSPRLNHGTLYILDVALIFSCLVALVFLTAPLHLHAVASPTTPAPELSASLPIRDPLLPSVPTSARSAHATLSDEEFEYLAAAVIMARDHCRFHSHVGGSGDQGIDVHLRNQYGFPVVVQAKRYEPGSTVPSYMVRDFIGALGMENAVYGHFVTTASLTNDGNAAIRRSPRTIHVTNGATLDVLLKSRNREIAQCLYEIKHGARV